MPGDTAVLLVDTDVFSFLFQDRPQASEFRDLVTGAVLVLSFTTVAELFYGARKAGWGARRTGALEAGMRPYAILPYTRRMSQLLGDLRADLEQRGAALETNDLWIAATALHYGIPLVTNNRDHFSRVRDLELRP